MGYEMREINIPEFVNRSHAINKRNAARRARCFHNRINRIFKAGVIAGLAMVTISCFIIGNPEAAIPWGLLITGSMITAVSYILWEGTND